MGVCPLNFCDIFTQWEQKSVTYKETQNVSWNLIFYDSSSVAPHHSAYLPELMIWVFPTCVLNKKYKLIPEVS